MYNFHASTSAYAEFWNSSFSYHSTLTRRHIWQAFLQESLRIVASASGASLILHDSLTANEVATQAFEQLGENGVIRSANHHECSECTHPYKARADILTGDDPAAVVGIDENRNVPSLQGDGADLAVRDAAQARQRARMQDVAVEDEMEVDIAPVRMVVVDGIVMGHPVCACSYLAAFVLMNISIVHLKSAPIIWQMLGVVYFVVSTSWSMDHVAGSATAPISRCREHKPANSNNTRSNGINMSYAMVVNPILDSTALYVGPKMKPFPGFPRDVHQLLHMIKAPQHSLNEPTTFRQADSTVLRQSVHHVELLLLGPNSQNPNPPQTLSIFWVLFSPLRNLDQILCALTRHASYFALPLAMAAGILGRTQLGSLSTPITTSITGLRITCVVNGAILLH
jgi:hypothetical protein